MQSFLLVISLFYFATQAYGESRHGHKHEHGHAELDFALDTPTLTKVELRAPAESVYGFETEAKTEQQKKQVADAMEKLKTKISEMLIFDKALGCTITLVNVEPFVREGAHGHETKKGHEHEKGHKMKSGEHGETHAQYDLTCAKPVRLTTIGFNIGKVFPKIKKLKVQYVHAGYQTGGDFKSTDSSMEVK